LMVLLKTDPLKHFGIERDLRKRIVSAFSRENVRFAYPQSVVHLAPGTSYEGLSKGDRERED
jgi:hypothetical protein